MTTAPVLVGFDGSDESRDAVALGRSLAAAIGAPLVVGAVLDYFPEDPLTAAVDSFEAAVAEDRGRLEGLLRKQLSDDGTEFDTVLALSAAHGLQELAEEHAAEVVVVGSTHRGPFGRVALGSMAERLLSGSTRTVAVAPRGYSRDAASGAALRDVGVAYDASPESHAALGFAAGLAAAAGARLAMIRSVEPWAVRAPVVPGVPVPITETPEQREARERAAEESLERALARIDPEIDARGDVEVGRAEEVLLERSAALDLLVMGSRGYGPVRRVLLGSVSSKVARAAECPVLVVPRAEDGDDEVRHRVLRATGEVAVGLVPLRGV